jgi:glycosyltransferase involved in cell wall biosynthesis
MMPFAILCSQFPETHETFIVRELLALRAAGFPFKIYSLKQCRDRVVQKSAVALKAETVYVTEGAGFYGKAISEIIRHPGSSLSSFALCLRMHWRDGVGLLKALAVWFLVLSAAEEMRRDGVRHVHAHWATMPATGAMVLARALNVTFSFTAHAWDIFVRNPSLAHKVRAAKGVLTCTQYNRDFLRCVCPEADQKIHLSYHGVQVEKLGRIGRSAEGGMPVFLTVGRLVEQKGFAYLIEACRLLKQKGLALKLVMVGNGPLAKSLKAQIDKAGLAGAIDMIDTMPQEELFGLYAKAYAFVLPCVVAANQDRDGIPNVLLEAMAAGMPVISTTISGVPEAVRHGENGILVAEKNAEELAGAMADLLSNPERARILGEAAKRSVHEKFAEGIHLANLVRLMESMA